MMAFQMPCFHDPLGAISCRRSIVTTATTIKPLRSLSSGAKQLLPRCPAPPLLKWRSRSPGHSGGRQPGCRPMVFNHDHICRV